MYKKINYSILYANIFEKESIYTDYDHNGHDRENERVERNEENE